MTKTHHTPALTITTADNRAVATLSAPGLAAGTTVSRSGADEEAALAATLRALADTLDAQRRADRRAKRATEWVRMSILVDVRVPMAEIERARICEDRGLRGDMVAAGESLNLALGWIGAALHDNDAREWISFNWSPAADCPAVREA